MTNDDLASTGHARVLVVSDDDPHSGGEIRILVGGEVYYLGSHTKASRVAVVATRLRDAFAAAEAQARRHGYAEAAARLRAPASTPASTGDGIYPEVVSMLIAQARRDGYADAVARLRERAVVSSREAEEHISWGRDMAGTKTYAVANECTRAADWLEAQVKDGER